MTEPSQSHGQGQNQSAEAEFDEYAAAYDEALQKGLHFTGESKEYFAEARVEWITALLKKALPGGVSRCLDYGCGVGTSAEFLTKHLGLEEYWGFDPSPSSISMAKGQHTDRVCNFTADQNDVPLGTFDLAFCNGVFHHIPPDQRKASIDFMARSLRPGGVLMFWENNAWNPMVRFMMNKVPFDRDAVLLFPSESRGLAEGAGLEVVRTDYLFIFPNSLAWARGLEPFFCKLPLGGQYLVMARAKG